MITLALAQLVYFAALRLPFTNAEDGIQAVPRGYLFGLLDLNAPLSMYYTTAGIFLLVLFAVRRVIDSPFGRVLAGIRENEARVISLGFHAERYKTLAFVLSAALSGLAGATKAIAFQFASLQDVHWVNSGDVIVMTMLGGVGTLIGPVVGAAIIVSLEEFLAQVDVPALPIIGAILIACVLLLRRGMVGELEHVLRRRTRRA